MHARVNVRSRYVLRPRGIRPIWQTNLMNHLERIFGEAGAHMDGAVTAIERYDTGDGEAGGCAPRTTQSRHARGRRRCRTLVVASLRRGCRLSLFVGNFPLARGGAAVCVSAIR